MRLTILEIAEQVGAALAALTSADSVELLPDSTVKLGFIYGHFDECNSCGIELHEYVRYNQEKNLFETVNASYKADFVALMGKLPKDLSSAQKLTLQDTLTTTSVSKIRNIFEEIVAGKEQSISDINLIRL